MSQELDMAQAEAPKNIWTYLGIAQEASFNRQLKLIQIGRGI
jgi:hypothetical protein